MKKFKSVEEILNFAIKKEEEAAKFYEKLAGRVEKPWMREALKGFAREEASHKQELLAIKEGARPLIPSEKKVADLKLAEYLEDVEPKENLDYKEALVLAMKREKNAFRLYTDLAAATDDENLRRTLQALAQEEAKHKLHFEVEYDEHFLQED